MRLIDADALCDRLQNLAYDDWNQGTGTTWANAFAECVDIVDNAPTIQPELDWIPCSERLPEESQDVLVCTKYQGITDGMHERGTWWIAWGERCYEDEENLILAWMPVPEPYREEGGE